MITKENLKVVTGPLVKYNKENNKGANALAREPNPLIIPRFFP